MAKLRPPFGFAVDQVLKHSASLDAMRQTVEAAHGRLGSVVDQVQEWARQNEETIRRVHAAVGPDIIEMSRRTMTASSAALVEIERVHRSLGQAVTPSNAAVEELERTHRALGVLGHDVTRMFERFESTTRSLQKMVDDLGLARVRAADRLLEAFNPTRLAEIRSAFPAHTFDQVQQWAAAHAESPSLLGSLTPEQFGVTLDENGAAAWGRLSAKVGAITSGSDAASEAEGLSDAFRDLVASAGSTPEAQINVVRLSEQVIAGVILYLLTNGVPPWAVDLVKTLLVVFVTLTPATPPEVPALFVPSHQAPVVMPSGPVLPKVIADAGPRASTCFAEFFTAHTRNANTRAAYARAIWQFCAWLDERDIELHEVQPVLVAMYIEQLQQTESVPTTKQALSAIRMMFDHLVLGQVLPFNPAASVRGPKHVVKRGKTPVLSDGQTRQLLDSIDGTELIDLRDRALIGVMAYSFARVSAATSMKVRDYFKNGKRCALRLHEKGGKVHEVPAHHKAEEYLDAYIAAAGMEEDQKGPLFRSFAGRTGVLQRRAMHRNDALRMIYRRAEAAGLDARVCCHTFRATGITNFLSNGGTLAKAQQIAAHSSPRTTKLYERTNDELTLDEIERIRF